MLQQNIVHALFSLCRLHVTTFVLHILGALFLPSCVCVCALNCLFSMTIVISSWGVVRVFVVLVDLEVCDEVCEMS